MLYSHISDLRGSKGHEPVRKVVSARNSSAFRYFYGSIDWVTVPD